MSTLSNREKLQRLVYLNTTNCCYTVGSIDNYPQTSSSDTSENFLKESAETNLEELLAVIKAASSDPNIPNRVFLFSNLSKILNFDGLDNETKHKVTSLALEICQNDRDFFDFIKYHSKSRNNKSKLSSSVIKAVGRFYASKSPLELAQSYSQVKSYHKWSHKDLIKLAHVKSDTPMKNIVINYILQKTVNEAEPEDARSIINIMKESEELRKTNDSSKAVKIISEFKYTIHQVSPELHQSNEVWAAALKNMSLQDILPNLGKLYRLGLLKQNSPVHSYLLDLFTSSEKVKVSGVHPMEVFLNLKKLEKGGRPIDLKLLHYLQNEKKLSEDKLEKAKTRTEAKCSTIINALYKCFRLACDNVIPTNKRYLVTIDVSENAIESHCIGNKTLTCIEAAVSFTLLLLKVEKNVTVASYLEDKIHIINVDKKVSFADLLEKVSAKKSSYLLKFAPIEWASKEKKKFDVFINIVHHFCGFNIPKERKVRVGIEPFEKYRKNVPNAKLVTFCPPSAKLVVAATEKGYDTPDVLDVLGFDTGACKAIESFSRGTFR